MIERRRIERQWFRLQWGREALDFDSEDDLMAFAREQGCEQVQFWPMWRTNVA